MEPFTGLTLFHWALGALGFYCLMASMIIDDRDTHWYKVAFITVLFVFMGSGLYFYNIPPI